tara:strand:- start:1207 stop:1389 length:183 start_codon:yes stop_codon:yes gene_type:complete
MLTQHNQLKQLKKDLQVIRDNLGKTLASTSSVKVDQNVIDSYALINKHLVFNGVLTSLEY